MTTEKEENLLLAARHGDIKEIVVCLKFSFLSLLHDVN